jgi:hypothetical protein
MGVDLKRSVVIEVGIGGMVGKVSRTKIVGKVVELFFDCFKVIAEFIADFLEEFEDGLGRRAGTLCGHAS